VDVFEGGTGGSPGRNPGSAGWEELRSIGERGGVKADIRRCGSSFNAPPDRAFVVL